MRDSAAQAIAGAGRDGFGHEPLDQGSELLSMEMMACMRR